MSSPSTPTPPPEPTTAILAVAAAPTSQPPRKFPAPCWTHDETLALIGSYQDKWYSLRRRNLRTADWDAVAVEVSRRCPDAAPPPKSSAQCRHKMEKLRKRYRTEKQRINSLPVHHHAANSRFFGSSWIFFDLMDSMELGSGVVSLHTPTPPPPPPPANHNHNHGVAQVDLEVKPYSMNDNHQNHVISSGNSEKKGDLGKYFDEIMLGMGGGGGSAAGNKGKTQNHHDFDGRSTMPLAPAPHIKIKVRNQQYSHHDYPPSASVNDDFEDEDEYMGGVRGRESAAGFKRKSVMGGYESKGEDMYSSRMMLNGRGPARKEKEKEAGSARGRESSVVGEMVASIKMLGEGLVRMEKMKMEMMRDIEKMRMEMEMKRSEMILESQHLIVNAFIDGLKKNKKVKVMEIE